MGDYEFRFVTSLTSVRSRAMSRGINRKDRWKIEGNGHAHGPQRTRLERATIAREKDLDTSSRERIFGNRPIPSGETIKKACKK